MKQGEGELAMKVEKWFDAVCDVVTEVTLAACGSGGNIGTEPVQESPEIPAAAGAVDGQAADQALVNADFGQLADLILETVAHEEMVVQTCALKEQVQKGEAAKAALLEAWKQLSDDSQHLLALIQSTRWQTAYYTEHAALLTASVEALAKSELTVYEAAVENDDSKLESIPALTAAYRENLDALCRLMGIE
jgi:hypothetical protein